MPQASTSGGRTFCGLRRRSLRCLPGWTSVTGRATARLYRTVIEINNAVLVPMGPADRDVQP